MSNTHEGPGAIFDVDGTLLDSYQAHFESWRDTLEGQGITYGPDQFARDFGRRNPEIIRELWEERGLDKPSDDLIETISEQKEAAFRSKISRDFPMMPGADDLLARLHDAGWRIAIGSSAPRENVALSIEKLGVASLLDGIVCGEDVSRGKPHPDVFLHAASLLGIDPGNCVVIEDAAAGIEAAHRAGMPAAVIVSRGRTRDELAEAETQVDSLDELGPEELAQVIKEHVA